MKMTCKQMIDRIKMLQPLKGADESERFFATLVDRSIDVNALPDFLSGITKITHHAFYRCTNLALTSLPDEVTYIDSYAFSGCSNLAITSFPAKIRYIYNESFAGCTGLTILTFKNKPSYIASNAFKDCANLATINVPWSEGEVANAPWGATNATINYNYTGE